MSLNLANVNVPLLVAFIATLILAGVITIAVGVEAARSLELHTLIVVLGSATAGNAMPTKTTTVEPVR